MFGRVPRGSPQGPHQMALKNTMVILIPLTLFFLAWGAMRRGLFSAWREACLFSSILVCSLSVLCVEVLSSGKMLASSNLISFWVLLALLALHWAWFGPGQEVGPGFDRRKLFHVNFLQILALIVLSGTFVIALKVAPNSFDSMVYHLPRVMHWLQEGSVAFYPSDVVCQNWHLPGAQYLLMHVYALTGHDLYVNLVQWASLAGAGAAVSLLAGYLGSGLLGRGAAVVMAVTMPTALLQSTTSQSDIVFSFFILTAVVFIMRSMSSGLWRDVICAACAYGLAMLTKGTALYFFPFVIWLAVDSWRRFRLGGLLRPLAVLVITCIFMTGWLVRYHHDRVHAQAGQGVSLYYLGDYSLAYMLSNASKHLFSECNIDIEPVKDYCRSAVEKFNNKLGVALDDESTTIFGFAWDALHPLSSLHEDHIGNLVQIILLVLVCVAAMFIGEARVRPYLLCLLISVTFFLFTLRWGPTINRFHVPFLLMAVPVVGIVWGARRWSASLFAICLFLLSLPCFFKSVARPIEFGPKHNVLTLPRNLQYFANRRYWPSYIKGHAEVAKYVQQGCREVGLIATEWSWEYPLWALSPRPVRFYYVSTDMNKPAQNSSNAPCMIVVLQKKLPGEITVAGRRFCQAEDFFAMQIFLPSDDTALNER